jgi:hypothetical protein
MSVDDVELSLSEYITSDELSDESENHNVAAVYGMTRIFCERSLRLRLEC